MKYPNARAFLAGRTSYDMTYFLNHAKHDGHFCHKGAKRIYLDCSRGRDVGYFSFGLSEAPEVAKIYGPNPKVLPVQFEGTICQRVFRIFNKIGESPNGDSLPFEIGVDVGFSFQFSLPEVTDKNDYFIILPEEGEMSFAMVETLLEESTKGIFYHWPEPQRLKLCIRRGVYLERDYNLEKTL